MTTTRLLIASVLATLLTALGAASAAADDVRINRYKGEGAKAAAVAKKRIGGGTVTSVTKDRESRKERYEVKLRKGAYRYEVELSYRFRITDIDRDRISRDDDDDDDDDD